MEQDPDCEQENVATPQYVANLSYDVGFVKQYGPGQPGAISCTCAALKAKRRCPHRGTR